jgi:hypothetical protein
MNPKPDPSPKKWGPIHLQRQPFLIPTDSANVDNEIFRLAAREFVLDTPESNNEETMI